MTDQTNKADLDHNADRAEWEAPSLVRLDAADAEAMVGAGSDMMSQHSMNS